MNLSTTFAATMTVLIDVPARPVHRPQPVSINIRKELEVKVLFCTTPSKGCATGATKAEARRW
jgi:hypothetical protein